LTTVDFMKIPPIVIVSTAHSLSAMARFRSGPPSPPIDPIFGVVLRSWSPARIPDQLTSSILSGSAGTAIPFGPLPKLSGGVTGLPHAIGRVESVRAARDEIRVPTGTAARFHHPARQRSGEVATRGARAAVGPSENQRRRRRQLTLQTAKASEVVLERAVSTKLWPFCVPLVPHFCKK
jgi:hypothetical protein